MSELKPEDLQAAKKWLDETAVGVDGAVVRLKETYPEIFETLNSCVEHCLTEAER